MRNRLQKDLLYHQRKTATSSSHHHVLYSSSLSSSSSPAAAAFLAGFFFFLFFGLLSFARGRFKISRTSSSVIFLSVLNLDKSGLGGAASFCRPFFVIAVAEHRLVCC